MIAVYCNIFAWAVGLIVFHQLVHGSVDVDQLNFPVHAVWVMFSRFLIKKFEMCYFWVKIHGNWSQFGHLSIIFVHKKINFQYAMESIHDCRIFLWCVLCANHGSSSLLCKRFTHTAIHIDLPPSSGISWRLSTIDGQTDPQQHKKWLPIHVPIDSIPKFR